MKLPVAELSNDTQIRAKLLNLLNMQNKPFKSIVFKHSTVDFFPWFSWVLT